VEYYKVKEIFPQVQSLKQGGLPKFDNFIA